VRAAGSRESVYLSRMAPEIQAFDHIHVHVADRAAAEAWYRKVLGLQRSPELEFWTADGGPLTVQNASGSIHIALFERAPQPSRTTIAMRVSVSAYREWKAHLREVLVAPPSEEDHQLSMSLYFRDPDGNPYEITTYEYDQAKA
jgi:catechol-2,3-dioxygenase